MLETRWILTQTEEKSGDALAREMMISPVVARLLVSRGITTPDEARDFLDPSMDSLHDPSTLPDIDIAVQRLKKALKNGERIMVHGDYDVDGVTGAALLIRVLRALKADVIHRVPHRQNDGYDIKPHAIEAAKASGASLVITCDCGMTAYETAQKAVELGIDLIVTDHHEPGLELPRALAVVNPHRNDSRYPFSHLAGVGVAFKVMDALVRELGFSRKAFQNKFLDLVALGTVSDVCPLIGENRVMVKFGMQALAQSAKAGLQAMLRKSDLQGKILTAYHLSHILGPRINAVGRMDSAEIALDLMLTTDTDKADRLADILDKTNLERQAEQSRVFEEALERIRGLDLGKQNVLVLSAPGWNTGVVGIVASKVVEQYCRPAILLAQDPESGECSGSARSIEQFNLIAALRNCGDLLDKCGGHERAAGLSLSGENLEGFAARLNELAGEVIKPEDMIPSITVDAVLAPDELDQNLAREIAALEPFGNGNPEPVFVTSGLEIIQKQRVGADGSHLKMRVGADDGTITDCIGFGKGDLDNRFSIGSEVDICYNIRINSYNGYENLQLVARDLKESGVDVVTS